MSPTPERVSIVIPLYNAEKFIEETIRSILSQTFQDIRIYVIDDLSTDGSVASVKHLCEEDSRVEYHLMPRKGGYPAPTKNEGIRLSKGFYVAFCDHDDWWHPEKLAKQVEYLDQHPEVTILGCNVEIVDTTNKQSLGTYWKDVADFSTSNIRQLVLDAPIFATTSCMVGRRDYLLKNLFDERFMGCDEYDMSLHAALDDPHQITLLPEVLAYWRWHSDSLSHSSKAAARALKDETIFAEKILSRSDLSEPEREQVVTRLTQIIRRAANEALEEGQISTARTHYIQASRRGDRLSKVLLLTLSLVPPLAKAIVTRKRSYSHNKPVFR